MNDIPFVAISNDQLGKDVTGEIVCPHCGQIHTIQDSNPPLLQWYKCGEDTYLYGIKGRTIDFSEKEQHNDNP
jgi:hypothetical protein